MITRYVCPHGVDVSVHVVTEMHVDHYRVVAKRHVCRRCMEFDEARLAAALAQRQRSMDEFLSALNDHRGKTA